MNQIDTTKADLLDAIVDNANNVVALVGHWGVGKTYLWERVRKENSTQLQNVKPNYAYVSLFGLSNIGEVRSALFSQFVSITTEDASRGAKSKNALIPYVEGIQKILSEAGGLCKVGAEGMGAAIELMKLNCIDDMLVCFDDFERVADELKPAQILGLINELTTRRRCKVLLILNDNKLGAGSDKFEEYRERVIDKIVRFEPSFSHALEVAVPDCGLRALMSPSVEQLGCRNIRVIRRMHSTIEEIARRTGLAIDAKTPEVISAVCLLSYCHLVRNKTIPNVDDVLRVEYVPLRYEEKEEKTQDTTISFLRAQNWRIVTKCDRLIGDLVSRGLSNWAELKAEISEYITDVDKEKKKQEIHKLWQDWRSKLRSRDKSNEYADHIIETVKKNIDVVNAREIDDTYDLMKSLLNEDRANELLDAWKETHKDPAEAFDLQKIESFGKLKNENFRQYIVAHAAEKPETTKAIAKILTAIHVNQSWGSEDFRQLVNSTPEQYANSFRTSTTVDLALRGWIGLVNSEPITSDSQAIFKAGKEALEKLACESPSNKMFKDSALRQVRAEILQATGKLADYPDKLPE